MTRPWRLGCDLWRLQPDGVHQAEAASTAGPARRSLRRNPGCGRLRRPWHSLKRLFAVPRRYLADLFSCAEASHQSGPVSVSVSVSPAAIITKTDLDGIACLNRSTLPPRLVSTLHEASDGFKKKQTRNGAARFHIIASNQNQRNSRKDFWIFVAASRWAAPLFALKKRKKKRRRITSDLSLWAGLHKQRGRA